MSEDYTFDQMWVNVFGCTCDEWDIWYEAKPKWWQFRKRKEWMKNCPAKKEGADRE